MNASFNFGTGKGERIAYIRPVAVTDLPADVQAQAGALRTIWAVHGANGERLALVADRGLAFLLARQNDLEPVSAH